MTKYEIMNATNVTAIANKELKKSLNDMLKAIETGKKSTWQFAYALAKVVKTESYKDDFESIAKFADYIGMSKGTITQYVKAVEYCTKWAYFGAIIEKPDFANCPYTIANAYFMSTIGDNEQDFITWLDVNYNVMPWNVSIKSLKAFYKEYESDGISTDDTATDDTATDDTATDDTATDDTATDKIDIDTKDKAIVFIKALMIKFDIDVNEIA